MDKTLDKKLFLSFGLIFIFILLINLFLVNQVKAVNQIPGPCLSGGSATKCASTFMPQVSGLTDKLSFGSKSTGDSLIGKIGFIINLILSFLGVVFLGLTIFSGIQWLWAGDNSEEIKKVRQRLINSVIGLLIVLAAYGISYFVFSNLENVVRQ